MSRLHAIAVRIDGRLSRPPLLAVFVALTALACTSGNTGAPGPAGAGGPAGAAPAAGAASGGCTLPCHGFENGLVVQWRASKHYAASALALETETAMTVQNGQYCGGCHAIDGLERRVAKQVGTVGGAPASNVEMGHINYTTSDGGLSQVLYSGQTTSSEIHCTTCHAFGKDNDPHVTGVYQQVPLRVPAGEDHVFVEKSPPDAGVVGTALPTAYGPSNMCVFCHKSTKDATAFISLSRPTAISPHWGPHNGTQSDLFAGVGAFQWPGKTYDSSIHSTLPNGCSRCHMPPVLENYGVPDHTFLARLPTCSSAKNCHAAPTTSFDLAVAPHTQGGQTVVKALLTELRSLLCPVAADDAGDEGSGGVIPTCVLSRAEATPPASAPPLSADERADGQFSLDAARLTTPPIVLPGTGAAALFNYLMVVKSRDNGVHNPIFTQQLLWDSIVAVKGAPPASMPTRPTPLPPQR
jgi:hypothetical protein